MKDDGVPEVSEFVVTYFEFVGAVATTVTFYTIHSEFAQGSGSASDSAVQEKAATLFVVAGLVLGIPIIVALSCCSSPQWGFHWLCGRCSKSKWLHLPRYQATVQFLKLIIYTFCIIVFSLEDGFSVKTGANLASAVILALCDFLLSINTVIEVFMELRDMHYPSAKASARVVFISLWKDLGIITGFIRINELYFLLISAPFILMCTFGIYRYGLTSRKLMFHVLRIMCFGFILASVYIFAKGKVEYVTDVEGPVILAGAEVFILVVEMKSAREEEKDGESTEERKPSDQKKPADEKDWFSGVMGLIGNHSHKKDKKYVVRPKNDKLKDKVKPKKSPGSPKKDKLKDPGSPKHKPDVKKDQAEDKPDVKKDKAEDPGSPKHKPDDKKDKAADPGSPKHKTGDKKDKGKEPGSPKHKTGDKKDKAEEPGSPKHKTGDKKDKPGSLKLKTGDKKDKGKEPGSPKHKSDNKKDKGKDSADGKKDKGKNSASPKHKTGDKK